MKLGGSKETLRAWALPGQLSPVLPPRLAIIEIAVLLALVLLEYLWEGSPSLTRINPHPYWIAILLLSLQYGTVSGLIAAGIAIIGTVLIGMPEPDIEERYFNYLVRVWTQPVLWLLVALVLGTFRARQIEQRDELVQQVGNLKVRSATLLDHAANLRTRCTMLERSIATRTTPDAIKLLNALAQLSDAEPGRWAPALNSALSAGFPGAQISFYAIDNGQVRLILTHGLATAARPPAEIDAGHPLVAAVLREGRSVSVLTAADDDALKGLGVAAVPIYADPGQTAGSRIVGMLKADVVEPAQINASLTRRLGVVAHHLAPIFSRGLVSSVATITLEAQSNNPSAIRSPRTQLTTSVVDPIPAVRRWRMLRWLPGGRTDLSAQPDGKDD